jgi:hypothetical protein
VHARAHTKVQSAVTHSATELQHSCNSSSILTHLVSSGTTKHAKAATELQQSCNSSSILTHCSAVAHLCASLNPAEILDITYIL